MKSIKILPIVTAIACAQTISFAQAWTPTGAPNLFWMSIASSADGTKLAAVEGGSQTGPICTSTNSGMTWITNNVPYLYWSSIASSADGTKLVAGVYGGAIYSSTNSGANWVSNSVPFTYWQGVASSADGKNWAAVVNGGGIYFSTNSGSTWTPSDAPSEGWRSIATSADGTKMVAVVSSGGIYLSTNSGANWVQATNAPNETWYSVSSSAKGDKLAATALPLGSDTIYISTNSGAIWTPVSSIFLVISIASSADGTKLVAAASEGGIYTSSDSGFDRALNEGTQYTNWQIVASSADGGKLLAGWNSSSGGGISILQNTLAPKINIKSETHNIKLSWIVPSTTFVLERSPGLASANWTLVTNTPGLNFTNLQNELILPQTNSSFFFQLKTP